MTTLRAVARRWPLSTFTVLTVACTWPLLPFASVSIAISLVALCGPAVAAVATAALLGHDALRELGAYTVRWRVPLRWYLAALLLPLPVSALAAGLVWRAGAPGPIEFLPVTALGLIVFALVAGEEIGWRGFALPRLLARVGPWGASAILGVVWAAWHLPLFFMPTMPQYGSPFPAFIGYTIGLSLILTVLAQRTRGSLVIATLFHGAVNTIGFTNTDATAAQRGWGNAAAYLVVASLIGGVVWRHAPAARNSNAIP